MLETIHIENFVLAKNITINLNQGFNVFTGETGAGKTLIINAIRYGMGDTFSKDIFANNTQFPHVQLLFAFDNKQDIQDLFETDEEIPTEILCERWMTESGKSRSKINGILFSLPDYQRICKGLINIHGQNSLDDLLSRKKQMFLFDSYFKDELNPITVSFSQTKKEYFNIIQELSLLTENQQKREREIDFITYQIHEINAASLKPGELVQIKQERDLLSNAQKIITNLKNAVDLLDSEEKDGSPGIISLISALANMLEPIKEFASQIQVCFQSTMDSEFAFKETLRDLSNLITQIESQYDELKLNEIIIRIDQINHLQKKYGISEEEILLYKEKLEKDLQNLELTSEILETKQKQKSILQLTLIEMAEKISRVRKSLKSVFEQKIDQELHDLSMENAKFQVEFEWEKDDSEYGLPFLSNSVKIYDHGIDKIDFKIKTNPGQPDLPISQIASGGELSRIMLAIKTIIGTIDPLRTLIFDEIDTGIGGNTGNAIGFKLKHLGESQQIICITHLPQIASKADNHFIIEKSQTDETTVISINRLKKEDRVQEIARMLDGNSLSTTSLNHAREMLEL